MDAVTPFRICYAVVIVYLLLTYTASRCQYAQIIIAVFSVVGLLAVLIALGVGFLLGKRHAHAQMRRNASKGSVLPAHTANPGFDELSDAQLSSRLPAPAQKLQHATSDDVEDALGAQANFPHYPAPRVVTSGFGTVAISSSLGSGGHNHRYSRRDEDHAEMRDPTPTREVHVHAAPLGTEVSVDPVTWAPEDERSSIEEFYRAAHRGTDPAGTTAEDDSDFCMPLPPADMPDGEGRAGLPHRRVSDDAHDFMQRSSRLSQGSTSISVHAHAGGLPSSRF